MSSTHIFHNGLFPFDCPNPSEGDDLTAFSSRQELDDYFHAYMGAPESERDTTRLVAACRYLSAFNEGKRSLLEHFLTLSKMHRDVAETNDATITLRELYDGQITWFEHELSQVHIPQEQDTTNGIS
jgi:hypothetical protein